MESSAYVGRSFMAGKIFLFALVLFLSAIPAGIAGLDEWDIVVHLNDDKTTTWNVSLGYNETVTKSDYYIFGNIINYNVLADDSPVGCRLVRDFGSSIVCDNIEASRLTYNIKTGPLVADILQNFRLFTYKFAATQLADRFTVTVKLPLGAALVERSRLQGVALQPFEPDFGKEGSDGRRILITWDVENPQLGETLDVAVVYEQLGSSQLGIFAVIVIALLAGFFAFITFFYKKQPIRDILPVLTDGERRVVEILLREGQADQRQIVKETDFSKAKVSRVINDLSSRGLVEKISRGRKNLIKLKTRIKGATAKEGQEGQKSEKTE